MMLGPGVRLGPYEIVSILGAGGMGQIYRARDIRLDRTVAIKLLPEEFSARVDRRQRFQHEARLISSLNHPHICALFDVGDQDGVAFLVMEYVEGETLEDRLSRVDYRRPTSCDTRFKSPMRSIMRIARRSPTGTSNPPTSCSRPMGSNSSISAWRKGLLSPSSLPNRPCRCPAES